MNKYILCHFFESDTIEILMFGIIIFNILFQNVWNAEKITLHFFSLPSAARQGDFRGERTFPKGEGLVDLQVSEP